MKISNFQLWNERNPRFVSTIFFSQLTKNIKAVLVVLTNEIPLYIIITLISLPGEMFSFPVHYYFIIWTPSGQNS